MRIDPNDFEPIVCSLRPCGRVADAIAAAGVHTVTLGMSQSAGIRELLRGVVQLVGVMNQFDIDLVQSLLYRANTLAGIAARFARRRPVVVAGQRSLYPLTGRRAGLATRWTRGLSDRVVAVSSAVRDELVRADGADPARIVVIENGVDTSRFRMGSDGAVRAALGFAPDVAVLGVVGRLSAEKGFDVLLNAMAQARAQAVPLGLVVAGDGPERGALEQLARTLGLGGRVKFLGMCDDPRPVYAAMDVFALPSRQEGLPNALLEAMAMGRAVVASAVGGVPELIEHERTGLLVAPGSVAELAESLTRLASDPSLRERLGREAARRVRDRYDVASAVDRHAGLYRELLSDPR